MPVSTKIVPSLITPDFAQQIKNNMSAEPLIQENTEKKEVTNLLNNSQTSVTVDEKRGKYSDVANLHFTRGKKAEFRAFFSAHEVTLVQGVETAVNYIMKEVKAGRLTISRNGIEKVGE